MKYYTSALLGFIIWGTFALVLKPLSAFGALDILIHRVIFAAISIVIACFLFRRKQTLASIRYIKTLDRKGQLKLIANVVSSAVFLAFNWFSFIYVMNAISVNATSLAYLICPILTTILASIFLNEKLNNGQWLAVVLAAISCVILAYGHFMDLFYSMIIALSYAVYLILQKNSFQIDKFFSLTIHIVVSMFLLLPLLSIVDTATVKTNEFYWLVLIIAVGYTIIPLFMNIFALKGLDSSVVGILMYLNPIISFFLAVFYYHEPINTQQIIAFSMIMLAILVFNIAYIYERKRKLGVQTIKHEL
ncbi:EamA family transporter [Sphingobacterium hotanense]|uniref:EamA family transporter n=1 Tax=Sphingobacterium hotanense TaxID=649196 RepID=A0ABT7NLQ9_9SPHI|nr:EamA family transporter [Sphingobacterium hotanense]MDM1048138.1 EamA family transporter [Sphingobacterium hotanense]